MEEKEADAVSFLDIHVYSVGHERYDDKLTAGFPLIWGSSLELKDFTLCYRIQIRRPSNALFTLCEREAPNDGVLLVQ